MGIVAEGLWGVKLRGPHMTMDVFDHIAKKKHLDKISDLRYNTLSIKIAWIRLGF